MITFWLVAAALCAVAVGFLLYPLWRQRRAQGHWSIVGIASAIAIVPLAAGLYLTVSTWNPEAAAEADQGKRLVEQLAERMRANPDDVEGWLLLARSYMVLGQYAQGRTAYREAWTRTPMPNNELKLAYAESMVLTDRAMLTGEAARLFEEVIDAEPNNPKALWYGGLVAQELGLEEAWRERWSRLLELGPPEDLANVLRMQLGAPAAAVGDTAPAAPAAPQGGPTVQLDVRLGEGRSLDQLSPQAVLFIFARAPGGGPPIAAIRAAASSLPGQFTLSDANSMIPGRSLGGYEELALVARISTTGQPAEQPGDWYAETTFRPADAGVVELVIDQVVQ